MVEEPPIAAGADVTQIRPYSQSLNRLVELDQFTATEISSTECANQVIPKAPLTPN